MGANQSTTSITSLNDVVTRLVENTSLTLSEGFTGTRGAVKPRSSVDVDELRSSKSMDDDEKPITQFNRQGKWARFSGTDEDLARTALQFAKFQAAKRRPLLKQISHSMSRRNGFNSQDEFDTADEQWVWSPNNSYDNLQLQAVNCSICGNYISVSNPDFPLPDHIQCNCNDGYDSYTENDDFEEIKEYEN
jgi:hypothetical protein